MIKFLDLPGQYKKIKPEIDNAIFSVIEEAAFIGGTHVKTFEENFAAYVGAEYCVGVNSGTDALEIALAALDLPEGSEVIVPANSFIASSEAVTREGLRVVFADVEDESYLLSIADVRQKITDKTRAIIAVHLYGHPCDMKSLQEIAKERDLFIIEDCAQAHGAEFDGASVGSIGHIGCFSFYPGKNLGAYGDGGAITTNDESLAIKSRMIANHGRIAKYDHEFEGRNSRLDGLQAAILNVKLQYLPEWTKARIAIADYYLEHLQGVDGLVLPKRQPKATQVYHLFVVRTKQRDELKTYLSEQGVQTGIHYPKALPKLKAYEYLDCAYDFKVASYTDVELLSLPIGEHLSLEDAATVVKHVKAFFAGK